MRTAKTIPTGVAQQINNFLSVSILVRGLTSWISGPAPLIVAYEAERHRRVRCIWFVGPFHRLLLELNSVSRNGIRTKDEFVGLILAVDIPAGVAGAAFG